MRRSIAPLALVLALFALPHALAAGAPGDEEPVAAQAVESTPTPAELDPSPAVNDAAPQATCPGGFTIHRLFPSGTPEQAGVDYSTTNGSTVVD
jgi:hypothetical protein